MKKLLGFLVLFIFNKAKKAASLWFKNKKSVLINCIYSKSLPLTKEKPLARQKEQKK
jgi:hypothetical protein